GKNSSSNQLSYSHGASTLPLLGETIGENLRKTVEKFSKHIALIVFSEKSEYNYEQLWEQTTKLSKSLMHLGIKKYDKVGIWCPNRFEWIIVQYATARIGAILVNINPSYQLPELEYVLNDACVKLIISAKSSRTSDYEQLLHNVKPKCPNLENIIIIDNEWHQVMNFSEQITDDELD
ncbi:unnamed protein product, partial [Didymodactylos carnosus]